MSIERLGSLAANFQAVLNEYNMRTAEVSALEEQLTTAKSRQDSAYERLKVALAALRTATADQAPIPEPVRANGRA